MSPGGIISERRLEMPREEPSTMLTPDRLNVETMVVSELDLLTDLGHMAFWARSSICFCLIGPTG